MQDNKKNEEIVTENELKKISKKNDHMAYPPLGLISKVTTIGLTQTSGPYVSAFQLPFFTFNPQLAASRMELESQLKSLEESKTSTSPRPGQTLNQTDQ